MANKLALYGAGKKSLLAAGFLLNREPDMLPRYLIENNDFNKIGAKIPVGNSGTVLEVISLGRLKQLYEEGACDKALIPAAYSIFDLREARAMLEDNGLKAEDILAMPFNRLYAPHEAEGPGLESWVQFDALVQIPHVDLHIVDHCNLNCESCANFGNLVQEEVVYPFEQIKASLTRLHDLCPNIAQINIIGGEPLLHPNWREIVPLVRKLFPYTTIFLVTNGILVKRLNVRDANIFKDNSVTFAITLYPPIKKNAEKLVEHLRTIQLPFVGGRRDFFERRLTHEKQFNMKQQFEKCGNCNCLRGNMLGYCAIASYTDYYNKYFGEQILPEDSGVDLFSVNSGKELLDQLHRPLELCRQCVACVAGTQYVEPWRQSKKLKDEWFIK